LSTGVFIISMDGGVPTASIIGIGIGVYTAIIMDMQIGVFLASITGMARCICCQYYGHVDRRQHRQYNRHE
jgi:hypothetical protein